MASNHLCIGFYLTLKAAQLFRSRCADSAISGNPELFIFFRCSRNNPYSLHLLSKSFIYNGQAHLHSTKKKRREGILSRQNMSSLITPQLLYLSRFLTLQQDYRFHMGGAVASAIFVLLTGICVRLDEF